MGKGYNKRRRIFDEYSNQLHKLSDMGFLPNIKLSFKNSYICPICTNQFSLDDLEEDAPNPLTLEDAPQKSLGGKASTLTCKRCNNRCGSEIDFHLTERLVEQDARKFFPNSNGKGQFILGGKRIQGEFKVDSQGEIKIYHSEKNNHLGNLKKFISETRRGEIITIEHKKSRVDLDRLEVALLKTAYILTFEKFGYIFLLNKCYDDVRKQLIEPFNKVYPEGFWTVQSSFEAAHEGVHFIEDNFYSGVYSIFALKTAFSTKRFGVYLPLPGMDYHKIIGVLKTMDAGFILPLKTMMGKNYLKNIVAMKELDEKIMKMHSWIR